LLPSYLPPCSLPLQPCSQPHLSQTHYTPLSVPPWPLLNNSGPVISRPAPDAASVSPPTSNSPPLAGGKSSPCAPTCRRLTVFLGRGKSGRSAIDTHDVDVSADDVEAPSRYGHGVLVAKKFASERSLAAAPDVPMHPHPHAHWAAPQPHATRHVLSGCRCALKAPVRHQRASRTRHPKPKCRACIARSAKCFLQHLGRRPSRPGCTSGVRPLPISG
jgi:hypothetical protein